MLTDILHKISESILSELSQGSKKISVIIGTEKKKQKGTQISIQLFRFGSDNQHKNYPVAPPQDRSVYGFTFFIQVFGTDYENGIDLIEKVADQFDKKPFLQVNTGHTEYELAFSSMELSMEEINHFWLAQRKPHAPVLFYQARISEI